MWVLHSVDCCLVDVAGFAILIKISVGSASCVLKRQSLGALLEHSLYLGWQFSHKHLLFDVFDGDIFRLFIEECGILGWPFSLALEAVDENRSTLLFSGAIFGAQV